MRAQRRSPRRSLPAVRAIIRRADPEQPVSDVRTLDDDRRSADGVARGAGARARRRSPALALLLAARRHPRPAVVRGVAARAGDRRAHRARRATRDILAMVLRAGRCARPRGRRARRSALAYAAGRSDARRCSPASARRHADASRSPPALAVADDARRQPAAGLARAAVDPLQVIRADSASRAGAGVDARAGRPYPRSVEARARRRSRPRRVSCRAARCGRARACRRPSGPMRGRRRCSTCASATSTCASRAASSRRASPSSTRELEAKGLHFRPHFWLSDEWFSPDGVPGIAIPFYLAHPRLRAARARTRCSRSRAARASGACASCATRPATRSRTPTACAAAAPAASSSAGRSEPYPEYYAPRPTAAASCPPRGLVRAEPSRRGLRRDLRGLADARSTGASATRAGRRCEKLEYVDAADARDRRRAPPVVTHAPHVDPLARAAQDAARALPAEARALRRRLPATSTTATCAACSRTPRARRQPAAAALPRAASAARCAAACGAGRASTSTRSTRCSTT